jgi:hypothetical protein
MLSNIENDDRIVGLLFRDLFDNERADSTELGGENQPQWPSSSMLIRNRSPSALSFRTLGIE